MSSSDSSTDEDEQKGGSVQSRSEELQKRLKQFRERKSAQPPKSASRCCQLSLPDDYNEYMDLEANFQRHGFTVIKGNLDDTSELPCLQWCPHRAIAWELVFRGELVCNHYYMRSGLVRKAELCEILSAHAPQCLPETFTAILDSPASRSAFIDQVEALSKTGVWILKARALEISRPPPPAAPRRTPNLFPRPHCARTTPGDAAPKSI